MKSRKIRELSESLKILRLWVSQSVTQLLHSLLSQKQLRSQIQWRAQNIATLLFSIVLVVGFSYSFHALGAELAKGVTCECEASSCAPCEVETGLTFYSAKCGPTLERVKSCKKPTCAAVENQKQCLALLGLKTPEVAATASIKEREPASQVAPSARAGEIGKHEGAARVIHASGPSEVPREGLAVFNGDIIETKTNGKVRVHLKDGSEMTVAANSRVRIENVHVDDKTGARKVALDLMLGKVRSHVTKKYEGDNSYTVKTKTAVAGVRGTDFVASFEPGEKEWVSEIRTLEGMVRFDRARPENSDMTKPASGVDVPVGTYASLTIGPPARFDDEAEFFKSINDGSMSPVFKMSDEDVDALNKATDFAVLEKDKKVNRGAASVGTGSDQICSSPSGQFNQCSFTCEGNPAGEKHCRSDLSGVACVRRLCRANGAWTEQTRLPASEGAHCQPGRPVVGDCGGYW